MQIDIQNDTLYSVLGNMYNDCFANAEVNSLVLEISLVEGYVMQHQLVSEGLLKSYPAEAICRRLSLGYKGKVENLEFIQDDKFDNDLPCITVIMNADSNPQMYDDVMDRELGVCGWFRSRGPIHGKWKFGFKGDFSEFAFCNKPGIHSAYSMRIKARFPISNERVNDFTKKVLASTKMFYHVSLERLNARIRRVYGNGGLDPHSSGKGTFWYPERNYLFGTRDSMLEWVANSLIANSDELAINNLRRIGNDIRKNDGDREKARVADARYQNFSDWPTSIYEVDLNKMVQDGHSLRLYRDNNWASITDAYFTPDQIPQEYLRDITKEIMTRFGDYKLFTLVGQRMAFDKGQQK